MILLIDNYDSFTESVSVLLRTGAEVLVRRNDALTLEEIAALAPEKIVISPAPARRMRRDFLAVIRHYAGKTPLLGVCLGHQAIAQRLARLSCGRQSCMAKPRLSSITAKGCFRG